MKSVNTYVFNLKKFTAVSAAVFGIITFVNLISSGTFIDFFHKYSIECFKNKSAIYSAIPLLSVTGDKVELTPHSIIAAITSVDTGNPLNVMEKNIFAFALPDETKKTEVKNAEKPQSETTQPAETPTEKSTITSINKSGGALAQMGVAIKNETSYNVDTNALYNEPLKLAKRSGAPQVLIIHTHGSESFNPTARNVDTNNNIVRVGREMKAVFEKNGISVVHSEIMHDIPKYNNSYGRALETIEKTLAENPSINIVLDVHRDAISKEDGTPVKVSAAVNGKEAAQVMFVIGTDESGLSHPNWKENLKLALKCQAAINGVYPNLARPINLRTERFNQNKSYGSMILEVGTHGNNLEEAISAGKYSAEAISKVINSLEES